MTKKEKRWDGATHIHGVIQWSNKINLRNIVPDYKMRKILNNDNFVAPMQLSKNEKKNVNIKKVKIL